MCFHPHRRADRGARDWSEYGNLFLLGAFAGLALVLAGMGIYSVISYAVFLRTHEIGIRMAPGASQQIVTHMVVKQGSVWATIGVVLGCWAP